MKPSSVNAKLAAKMHIRQVDVLERLSKIENGIDAMIPFEDFWRIITKANSGVSKTAEFAAVFEKLLSDVRIMIRKQFKELAYRSHDWVVDGMFYAIPSKILEFIAPIEPIFEQQSPDQTGKLVFGYGTIHLVYEDESKPFGVPSKLLKKELTDEDKEAIRRDVLFPPPSQAEINRIINTGTHIERGGQTEYVSWEKRFDGLSKLINDKKLAFNEIVTGYNQGENIDGLQKRLEPLVGGIKASARRIARTEGSRIAEQIQRRTWDDLGDMMVGVQIIAVLDERTRPEHATRNGRIYYRRPGPGQKSIGELPDLPDAPNCRCISTPVLSPPEEFLNDPSLRDAFRVNANPTGEPTTYEEWFKSASVAKRKMVTGVARYKSVESILADKREPRWSDFINPDGELLTVDQLENETATARTARIDQINREIKLNRKSIKAVASRGFLRPTKLGGSRDLRRTLSGLSFSGKSEITLLGIDEDDLEETLDDYIPGASVSDLLNLAGAPNGSKVSISRGNFGLTVDVEYSQGKQSVSATRIIRRDRGKTYLWNVKILVEPTRKSIGLDVFRRQVDAAVALGLEEIRCYAEAKGFNGYYTWAVFGYENPEKTLQDLLLAPGGKETWQANNRSFQGTFDLRPGSRSRQVLDRYYATKMQERNRQNQQPIRESILSHPALNAASLDEQERQIELDKIALRKDFEQRHGRPPKGDFVEHCPIDLSDTDDLDILHDIWDDLAREEEAKRNKRTS